MPKVAICRAESYDSKIILSAVERVCSLIPEIESLFRGRRKVFLKVNLLSPFSAVEKAIFTHPHFVRGVVEYLKNWNVSITVGDDLDKRRGDPFSYSGLRSALKNFDIDFSILKEKGFKEVEVNGELIKTALFSREALEADVLINLPKLKTHSFTIFTGAIKNMFGLIPHGLRLKYHREYIWNEIFSNALVDIFSIRKPDLAIMDAIEAMEGEGPSSGTPKRVNLILASQDSCALDAVAGKIIGLKPDQVFTTWHTQRRGLGTGDLKAIEILGEKIEDVSVPDFKHSAIATGLFRRYLPSFLYAYFQHQLVFIPEINRDRCTGCGDCQRSCPAGVITMIENKAWIDENSCLHCLCCHESCSFNSIKLKQKPVGWLIRLAASFWHRTRSLVS